MTPVDGRPLALPQRCQRNARCEHEHNMTVAELNSARERPSVFVSPRLAEDSQLDLRVAFSPIYGQRRRPDHSEANKTHVRFGRGDGAYGRRSSVDRGCGCGLRERGHDG